MRSLIKMRGSLHVATYGPGGALKSERYIRNMVIQVGKNWVADRMIQGSAPVMSHMALGDGVTPPNLGDTALQHELGRQPFDLTPARVDNVITFRSTFPAGVATGALTEAGLFNAAGGGTLLARSTFPVVTKGASDNTVITWAVSAG